MNCMGGFQLMQILDFLGMYFDAVAVEVFTFFQIGPGRTVRCLLNLALFKL